ncbi:beta galactosidase jelly roll domain-containing protein [Paenibacillus sp. TRM 82003]|nr:beta galactosidase jelly roll domain-containing protein [Paenibacillus sp. TRM 82003]
MWSFRFDSEDVGRAQGWHAAAGTDAEAEAYDKTIVVPFSWASPLSGVGQDERGIGWYRRDVQWTPQAADDRVFLRFGAVDYDCEVWVNGESVGTHQGGYGTFEFDVTEQWKPAPASNVVVVRAEDNDHPHQARGKQGYGEIRGIWQPVWLEARPRQFVRAAKFRTSIDGTVEATATVAAAAAGRVKLNFDFGQGAVAHEAELDVSAGDNETTVTFQIADPLLWSPETPHLYEGTIRLTDKENGRVDAVQTYFGIREIGTEKFDGREYRWITLNGKPVYLNGTLDQSFHPTGYFTYPTDDDMRDEIFLLKRLGLNFVRIHIKPEEPRKLYWADKLGILVMEDMPCFWGEPDDAARAAYGSEALEIIDRDYNHPSIFSWVMFNETWGLKTNAKEGSLTSDASARDSYLPATQQWVRETYRWAKRLDPTRIVEDNSPCNFDHVETDLNTWHFYINGYEQVRNHVSEVVEKTHPGSTFNYIGGHEQSDAPLMNSECGNVWGIENGAGDSDLAWHYRYMLNEFRRHDKMNGFVFTEFKDVVNEFNGYYRLDGTDKRFGYEWFVPGMTLADLHAPEFIVIDAPPCQTAQAGDTVEVKLLRSSFSDRHFGRTLTLSWTLWYDELGARTVEGSGSVPIAWDGYGVAELAPLRVTMPRQDAVAVLALTLAAEDGAAITRNFVTFDVRGGSERPNGANEAAGATTAIQVEAGRPAEALFPHHWTAIQGSKVCGGPSGAFVYEIELPDAERQPMIGCLELVFEASAKRLLKRHLDTTAHNQTGLSMMHGAKADPELNANTYHMTDEERHEAKVRVVIDGEPIETLTLPDDPADSRGVLSHHYQPVANKLDEAGSYGYLCRVAIPSRLVAKLNRTRRFRLELQADEGGLALYGRNAGRYPIDLMVRYT